MTPVQRRLSVRGHIETGLRGSSGTVRRVPAPLQIVTAGVDPTLQTVTPQTKVKNVKPELPVHWTCIPALKPDRFELIG